MPCICTIVSPPFWGAIADTFHNQKMVHIVCHISAAVLFFSIQFVSSFPLMCVMVFVAYFQAIPTFSLLDLAAMTWTSRIGGDYGKQRLYGAAGYGIGAYVTSVVASSFGMNWCFNIVLGVSCVSLVLLVRYIPNAAEDNHEGHKKGLVLRSMKQTLKQHDLLMLFVVTLLAGVLGSLIDNFLLLFVYDLSNEDANIAGVFVIVQTVSELPYFFLANSIIDRHGTALCVAISLLAAGLRTIVYVFTQHPWWVLPVETLHGLTYGLLVAAFTNYIYTAAAKGAEGTMIGLLATFQKGLGGGIASLAGGYIYDAYGSRTMWGVAGFGICPISLLCVGVFVWLTRRSKVSLELRAHFVEDQEEGVRNSKPIASEGL